MPLRIAVEHGNVEAFKVLIAAGKDKSVSDNMNIEIGKLNS